MGSLTVRRTFWVNGALTDPTSVVLCDPTAAYGIKRDDTAAVVVAANTAMTKDSTGIYSYTFTTPADGLTYTAYVKVVYDGVTHYFEQDVSVVTPTTDLSVQWSDLREEVAFYLGYTRTSASWTADQVATLNRILTSGLRQFYFPPPLPGEPKSHLWTFCRPITTLTTVIDDDEYDLPADFGALIGTIQFSAADNKWSSIRVVGVGDIERWRALDLSSGAPAIAAVIPKASTGLNAQTFAIALQPKPDAAYILRYQYQIVPPTLSASYAHPHGSAVHAETILQSCLAVAERMVNDTIGVQHQLWLERLAASVSLDRQLAPEFYGYNGDGFPGLTRADLRRNSYVTYNSTLYDGS